MQRILRLAAVLYFIFNHAASAGLLTEAQAAFDAGHWAEAADLARHDGSPAGLALAARAGMVIAGDAAWPYDDRMARLDQAERDADAALAADPDQAEAMLQKAIALGYRTRIEGIMRAFGKGWARQARDLFQKAEQVQPENPWARAVEGGWNAEIVLHGGGIFYGASLKSARAAFDRAMALDPGNPVFPVQYAVALVRLNRARFQGEALDLLARAAAMPAPNALAARMQADGAALAAALRGGNAKPALARLVPFAAESDLIQPPPSRQARPCG